MGVQLCVGSYCLRTASNLQAKGLYGQHHEKWDGTGYPLGLKGKAISEFSRCVAVADSYEALTSPRIYKPAYPPAKALEIMTSSAGHYDFGYLASLRELVKSGVSL